tara:strand:+ start:635 stop:784 length:150 start_codon:yes stop_codon:yes gene_type:complete
MHFVLIDDLDYYINRIKDEEEKSKFLEKNEKNGGIMVFPYVVMLFPKTF